MLSKLLAKKDATSPIPEKRAGGAPLSPGRLPPWQVGDEGQREATAKAKAAEGAAVISSPSPQPAEKKLTSASSSPPSSNLGLLMVPL